MPGQRAEAGEDRALSPSREADCDVIVIGGGPAGSTVSALLARRGWRVVMLEKDEHPRFHIGESLLPRNLPIFDELGVMDEIRGIGVLKCGADFTLPSHDEYVRADFANAMDPRPPSAFQVRRSEFDEILFHNAVRTGVEAHQRMRAVSVEFRSDDEVVVEGRNGSGETRSWTARFLVDASGRDGFLANKFDWRVKDPHHRSAAVFAHFDDVVRREGEEEGNISVYWFEHGWFWLIPLRDGRMSVGAVCTPDYLKSRKGTIDALLADAIALCPPLVARMRDAKIASEVIATGNFSYESKRMFARNYVLIGDAYAFIDPVFSTGVFLAMASARSAADVIDKSLDNPGVRERLLARHQREVRRWLKAYSWFIYRFNSPAMKRLVMTRNNPWGLKSAVISLLTGDTKREPRRFIRLGMFKGFYYLFSAMAWRQSRQWHREFRRSA